MVQGPNEKVQDFGSKLEYKFKILQERFPGRYAAVQQGQILQWHARQNA